MVGALTTLAGAVLDAQRHLGDATLSGHEAVVSFSNPPHALLASGIAIGGLGLFLVLVGPRLESRPRRIRLGVPVGVALALVVVLMVAAQSDLGHAHGAAVAGGAAGAAHTHAVGTPAAASATDAADHAGHDWTPIVDGPTEQLLQAQLAQARAAALRYPTVADALRAGFTLADGFSQGIGAHYMAYSLVDGVFDPAQPEMLLYAGEDPQSPVVGLMYYVDSIDAPEGFAGPYDVWHRHFETCLGPHGTHFVHDPEAQECHHHAQTGWMLHAWVVPGWESVQGVFSERNSRVQ